MKTINELLKLLLDHLINHTLYTGLCLTIKHMKALHHLINFNEQGVLLKYLNANSPNNKSSDGYWYKPGVKTYRIKWLKKHIKLTN